MVLYPITRKIITEFSARSSATVLYSEGTAEYEDNLQSIFDDMAKYDSLLFANEVFEQDGKFGLKNTALGVLIPPIYDEIYDYISYLECGFWLYAVKLNGKFGIVKADGNGTIVHPFVFDDFIYNESITNGWITLKDDKFGVLGIYYGKVVELLTPIYDKLETVQSFEGYDISDVLILEKDGKQGLFILGNVISPVFDRISIPAVMGWVRGRIGSEWYYIDANLQPTTDEEKAYITYTSHYPYKTSGVK